MKTTETNILNVTYDTADGLHRILIDKLVEYDYNGDMAVAKKMCTVITPDNVPMIFNVSPYTPLSDMHTMVKVWIDCGCPMDCDKYGIARKWDKISLHKWVAG